MRIKEFLYFSFFLFYQKIFLCIQKIKNVFVIFKKVGKKVVFRKQGSDFVPVRHASLACQIFGICQFVPVGGHWHAACQSACHGMPKMPVPAFWHATACQSNFLDWHELARHACRHDDRPLLSGSS